MRVFGLLAWHGWEYTRTAPCFLWIEGWPRQPGGLHLTAFGAGTAARNPRNSVLL